MEQAAHTQSQYYRPSGRVDPGRLAVVSISLIAAALGSGYFMYLTFTWGWYIAVFEAFGIGLLLAGLLLLALGYAHCRNRAVGAGLGILMGLIAMSAYYYPDMRVRAPALEGISHLPVFIALRTQVDGFGGRNFGPTPLDARLESHEVVFGWIRVIAEFGFLLGMLGYVGWARSARPYCETCRQWMGQDVQCYDPRAFHEVCRLVQTGLVHELRQLPTVMRQNGRPCTVVTTSACIQDVADATTDGCPVYCSVARPRYGPGHEGFYFNTIFARIRDKRLTSFEAEQLEAPIGFGREVAHRKSDVQGNSATAPSHSTAPAEIPSVWSMQNVEITDTHSAKLMSKRVGIVGTLLAGTPYYAGLLGLGALILGIYLADPKYAPWMPDYFGEASAALGFVILAAGIAVMCMGGSWPREPYLRRRLLERLDVPPRETTPPRQPMFVKFALLFDGEALTQSAIREYGILSTDATSLTIQGDLRRVRTALSGITGMREDVIVDMHHATNAFAPKHHVLIVTISDGKKQMEIALIALGPPWRNTGRAVTRRAGMLDDHLVAAISSAHSTTLVDRPSNIEELPDGQK